jgi:hypothetical protein
MRSWMEERGFMAYEEKCRVWVVYTELRHEDTTLTCVS